MASKKKTATSAVATPQPRLDAVGWQLCLGDFVNAIPDTPAALLLKTTVGVLDHFDSDYTFAHVAIGGQTGLARVACRDLRWEMPPVLHRPTAPKQRVRVVLAEPGQADAELRGLDGQLGWVVSLDYATDSLSMVTVRFDDVALESWPTAIRSTDLLLVPTPGSNCPPVPKPVPAVVVEQIATSVEPLRLTTQAWDLLEILVTCGGLVPHANLSSAGAQATLGELLSAGLVEQAGRDYRLTAAGEAAAQEAATTTTESAPVPTEQPANAPDFRLIPLHLIAVTRNTRKVFDEAALQELAESMKAHGLLQPIVVRRRDNGLTDPMRYELVAGERRYRAAQLAGLVELPATVRDLSDREFLEVQLLENLQRVDVRPADEAVAFAELLKADFSAEEIGQRVGKPAKFILQRAKLLSLIPFWMQLLEADRLPLVAAHELARLPPAGQVVVKKYMEEYRSYELKQDSRLDTSTVRHAISQEVTRLLSSAPWAKDDTTLFPSAGPCTSCPKNSGNCRGLFDEADTKGDKCLDRACFTEKRRQFVERRKKEAQASGILLVSRSYHSKQAGVLGYEHYNSGRQGEKGAVEALVVEGDNAGEIIWVVPTRAAAQAIDPAAAKAEREATIHANRLKKMQDVVWAEKLRNLFTSELGMCAVSPVDPQGAHAMMNYWIIRALTFGRTGTPQYQVSYLVAHYGWDEATKEDLDNSYVAEPKQNGHTQYMNRQLAKMPLLDKVALFFDLKIRDGLEQTEHTWTQENLVKVLPKSYQKQFKVDAEVAQRVADRYGKGKKDKAAA